MVGDIETGNDITEWGGVKDKKPKLWLKSKP